MSCSPAQRAKAMSLMGVDLGMTGVKAVAFDLDGKPLGQGYREYALVSGEPGAAELDAEAVWAAAEEAIGEAASAAHAARDPVEALAFSSMGEAVVPIGAEGRPLAFAPTCFDLRGQSQLDALVEKVGREELFRITAHAPHPMHTLAKILWWRERRPDLLSRASRFLCFQDFASFRMGVAEPFMADSLAGRMMLLDAARRQWSAQLLDLAGISSGQLPRLAPGGRSMGPADPDVCERLRLNPGCLVAVGGHDQPCAALGAGVIEEGMAVYGVGTTGCITTAYKELRLDANLLAHCIPSLPHAVEGMYASLAYTLCAGGLLKWFRDNLVSSAEREAVEQGGGDIYDHLVAEALPARRPPLVLPHFSGTGTPYLDPSAKGAIYGLTYSTTRGDLFRGLLEGIGYEMRLNLDAMAASGIRVRELRATGGGSRSRGWMQLTADQLNRPIVAMRSTEGGCLACAMLAGLAAGRYADLREAVERTVRTAEVFEPRPGEQAQYEERYALYREFYPAVRSFGPNAKWTE
ncbi:MAG: FGGY family carbohydrate kinase [Candidatus Sumerlaeota bacterium]|nr:FGGY family carbohydrate kinase [Candidatus Sumerlaeota bacterium]